MHRELVFRFAQHLLIFPRLLFLSGSFGPRTLRPAWYLHYFYIPALGRNDFMNVACIYDFDLTLTEEYQQFPILRQFAREIEQKHGITKIDDYFGKLCSGQGIDIGVGAMQQILIDCRDIFTDISNESMRTVYAPQIRLAPGLPDWFPRITAYAEQQGLDLEHHVVSAGFTPLIQGTMIAPYLASLRSGTFLEGARDLDRIKTIVDPNNKREEIIKICKGKDVHEDLPIDQYKFMYENVIVFGDGKSDKRKFNFVRERGGLAIGVYEKGNEADLARAQRDLGRRVHHLVPRDYSANSAIEWVVQGGLEAIAKRTCTLDYRMIQALQLQHLRNQEQIELYSRHLQNCGDCQERSRPTQIWG